MMKYWSGLVRRCLKRQLKHVCQSRNGIDITRSDPQTPQIRQIPTNDIESGLLRRWPCILGTLPFFTYLWSQSLRERREVTKWTPWNERNGKWQWTGWKRWNDGKKVTKGRGEFKTKGTRYREQERRVETKGKEVTNRSVELQRKDGRDEMDAWEERRR